ncbi:MAG: phytoene desaturase [Bacteroidales bacterium]|nr:phytoene desaturase [Bacteroidales bacterium]
MQEKKTVVIIGAGIGGITTAIYLAKQGYSIEIYEKNSGPGGRCASFIRDGHRFDLGATMLLMPGVYHYVFDSLGISLEEGNGIIALKDLYKIFYDDGSSISFTSDMQKMKMQLEKIEPGSYERSRKFIAKGYEIFNLGFEKLLKKNFYTLFQFANFKNIGLLIKLKTYISTWDYAKKFFSHDHLLTAYTFQNIYVGQSPFTSPALFSMIPAVELTEGSFFPKGGMYTIVEKLFAKAESLGVKFHFNINVTEIRTKGNEAEGLILEDGREINAGVIIANADLPYVYNKLLRPDKRSARLNRMRYTCSAICFHWGLDKVYPQLDHHNIFISDYFRDGLDSIFINKSVNDRPTFYIHAPVRTDPDAAPPGYDTISVIVGAGHIDTKKNQDWNLLKKKTHDAVIKRLKHLGLEDIEEHILFEICYTPETWEGACNIARGSVFGSLGHNILQMGYFRPHNRHDKYKNLYFVGGSTHPGNGIPNVLMSGMLVAERIISGK